MENRDSIGSQRMKRKRNGEKTSYGDGKPKLKVQNFERERREREIREDRDPSREKKKKKKNKKRKIAGIFVHHGRKKLDVVQSTSKLRFHPNRRLPRN